MNWWHRGEERYVEYGTSFGASRAFGIKPVAHRHDLQHEPRAPLAATCETVFETLDDADVRTAGTTYLMYRGRHRHEPSVDTALTRLAHDGLPPCRSRGPRELFYADMFASRRTPCRSQLGLPGVRDQHAGCVGEYLVEHDLFDFLLLSLPDNDTHSHKYGPFAQVDSIAAADRQIARVMDAGRRARRVPRGPRGDRLLGPLAVARSSTRSTCSGRSTASACAPPSGAARRRRDRGLPELARRAGLRARPRAARRSWSRASSARCSRSRASTS